MSKNTHIRRNLFHGCIWMYIMTLKYQDNIWTAVALVNANDGLVLTSWIITLNDKSAVGYVTQKNAGVLLSGIWFKIPGGDTLRTMFNGPLIFFKDRNLFFFFLLSEWQNSLLDFTDEVAKWFNESVKQAVKQPVMFVILPKVHQRETGIHFKKQKKYKKICFCQKQKLLCQWKKKNNMQI